MKLDMHIKNTKDDEQIYKEKMKPYEFPKLVIEEHEFPKLVIEEHIVRDDLLEGVLKEDVDRMIREEIAEGEEFVYVFVLQMLCSIIFNTTPKCKKQYSLCKKDH